MPKNDKDSALLDELDDILNSDTNESGNNNDASPSEGVIRKNIAFKALSKVLNNDYDKMSKHYLLLTRFDFEKMVLNKTGSYEQDDLSFISEYISEVAKLLESSNIKLMDLSMMEERAILSCSETMITQQIDTMNLEIGKFDTDYLKQIMILQNFQTINDGKYMIDLLGVDFCCPILSCIPKKGYNDVVIPNPLFKGNVDNFITDKSLPNINDAVGVAKDILNKIENSVKGAATNMDDGNVFDQESEMSFDDIDTNMGVSNNMVLAYKKKTTIIERTGRSLAMGLFGPLYGVNYIVENFSKNKYDVFGQILSGKGKTKGFGDVMSFKEPDKNIILNGLPILATSVSYFLRDKNTKVANILDSTPIVLPIIQNLMSGRNPLDYGYGEKEGIDFIQLGISAIPLLTGIFVKPLLDPTNENGIHKIMNEASTLLMPVDQKKTRIPSGFR